MIAVDLLHDVYVGWLGRVHDAYVFFKFQLV